MDDAVTRVFGIVDGDATYTPKTGAPYLLAGVLEFPDAIQEGNTPEFARYLTRLDAMAAEPVRGDRLTVDGVAYIVLDSRYAEEGSIRLLLDQVD